MLKKSFLFHEPETKLLIINVVLVGFGFLPVGSKTIREIARTDFLKSGNRRLRLSQELTDQALFLFVLDTSEKLSAEPADCFGFIERHAVIDFAAREMAGLASGLKDRPNLGFKVRLLRRRS